MQAETSPRNFNAASVPGLSSEARKALQIQTMDHMMDAWEEQIKSPNMPSAMISKLKSLPSFGAAGSWLNADALQKGAMNPFQLYVQFAEQWQKACTEAMAFWGKAGKLYDNVGRHSS